MAEQELKLNDGLVEILKQYAELVKDADENAEIGPHINFTRYKKFKEVRRWFESFDDKNVDPNVKRENLIRIFTTGSGSGSIDFRIRKEFEIVDQTTERLINANQQGGSFINLIKKINVIDTIDLGQISNYLNKVIAELSKIYVKEGDNYIFTDFEKGKYKDQNVFNELLFLLNIEKDKMPLKNGCYSDAIGTIKETYDIDYTYKQKFNEDFDKISENIVKLIQPHNPNEVKIPIFLKLDQFFNVIDKISFDELEGIETKYKDFYDQLFAYFNKNSKYFRQNKSLMNIFNNNKNTILHGPPGTGKTYQITQYLKDNANEADYRYIVFHPNYGYEDFIDGVKPTGFTETKQIKLELVNGHFKEFCIYVHGKSKDILDKKNLPKYYFVVDEINRANLSAVFGETLMLLEDSYRYKYFSEKGVTIDSQTNKNAGRLIHLKNSILCNAKELIFEEDKDGKSLFGIPENIYFIGMMNDVDKSVDSFDLALRRRFAWIERKYDKTVIMNELGLEDKDKYLIGIDNLNKFLLEKLSSSSFQLGHSYFLKIRDYGGTFEKTGVENLFNNHLKPLIKEYLRTQFSESEIEGKDGKTGLLKEAENKFLSEFTKKENNQSKSNGQEKDK